MELDPSHVNAQVALGIAALRDRDTAAARAPLEKAVVLEPRNPYARRTLGQLLLMEDETAAALPHLRAAAEVADDDPINLFTDAQALLASDGDSHVAEADALFKQAVRLAINDPSQKHTLRHYRGGSTDSALEAACVYYAGVKLLLPGQDPGLDLSRE